MGKENSSYDVVIIGGGAAGLSAAITLASAAQKFEWAQKKVLLIDSGKSDIRAASFSNAPGIAVGTTGPELLEQLWGQLTALGGCDTLKETEVTSLEKGSESSYVVAYGAKKVVATTVFLATGMQKMSIESSVLTAQPHEAIAREGKVKVANHHGKVGENLYVIGLAKGLQTMYAIAAGDGVARATKLLWEWSGKPAVPHDVV